MTKSANYCHHSMSNDIGFLILAEVALGDTNDLLHADYNANNLPDGKNSTKGCGSFGPKESNFLKHGDAMVPMGPGEKK